MPLFRQIDVVTRWLGDVPTIFRGQISWPFSMHCKTLLQPLVMQGFEIMPLEFRYTNFFTPLHVYNLQRYPVKKLY